MTLEQGRRLAALEKRLDASERGRAQDRIEYQRALSRMGESIYRLRCAVSDLERERVTP